MTPGNEMHPSVGYTSNGAWRQTMRMGASNENVRPGAGPSSRWGVTRSDSELLNHGCGHGASDPCQWGNLEAFRTFSPLTRASKLTLLPGNPAKSSPFGCKVREERTGEVPTGVDPAHPTSLCAAMPKLVKLASMRQEHFDQLQRLLPHRKSGKPRRGG